LGRDFTPTQAELARAYKTKADRFFWFDEMPGAAVYDGNAMKLGVEKNAGQEARLVGHYPPPSH
jgi:hypothetical protein